MTFDTSDFGKIEILPPDENQLPEAPDLIHEYIHVGGEPFNVLPPIHIDFPKSIVKEVVRVVSMVKKDCEAPDMPDFIRVDMAPTKDGRVSMIEINAQIPGGSMYLPISHVAFGDLDQADQIVKILESSWTETPEWIMGNSVRGVGMSEANIAQKEVFGNRFMLHDGSPDDIRESVNGGRPLRFMVDEELKFLTSQMNGELDRVMNRLGTSIIGDKSALANVDSALLPEGKNIILKAGEKYTVPKGWVCKAPISLGGKDVFFPGHEFEVAGNSGEEMTFALQEMIDIDTFDFKGVGYKYGLDMYLVRDKDTGEYDTFFISRICRDGVEGAILNVSGTDDGAMIPVVANMV